MERGDDSGVSPMMRDVPGEFLRRIGDIRDTLDKLKRTVWENPELAYQERIAVALQTAFLREHGFDVRDNYCDMETAYRADTGSGGELFAFVAEYDALPGLGHACGHNLICAGALAAAYALSGYLRDHGLPGRVAVIGSPGEESGGGKVLMLRKNCLDGVGACMMVHPAGRTCADNGSMFISRYTVEFHGLASHAAAAPWNGVNALDSVMLLFAGINAWRQHMRESDRIHGVVVNGGSAANIVPDYAKCNFSLRSFDKEGLERIIQRFMDMVKGAGLMTGARAEISELGIPYKGRLPNSHMNRVYLESVKVLGLEPFDLRTHSRGSSDFGDFSRVIPGIHPSFSISTNSALSGHSKEFLAASGSELGFENMLKAAAAMATVGLAYLGDTKFRTAVINEFTQSSIHT